MYIIYIGVSKTQEVLWLIYITADFKNWDYLIVILSQIVKI